MNPNLFFTPTDILLPAHADMRRWSVIACDQFTADAGYWQAVQDTVGDAPSTLRLMLPEFYLGKCDEAAATREIQQTMRRCLDDGVFRTVPHSLVLELRTAEEMLALLGDSEYRRYTYKYEHPTARSADSPSDLTPLLENTDDNVFIILSDNEVDIDRILAALASADTSLTSRGRTAPRFVVLGNTRWNRYNTVDRAMFFKNRVIFFSTYHAKRDSETVRAFDDAYIRSFGALPTLFSYRGYDTAMIFAPAMYGDIEYDLEDRRYTPLQTTYRFGQNEGRENHVNRNWTRVNYNSDFTITIE